MATSTIVPPPSTWCPYSSEARISPVRRVKRSRSTAPPCRWAPSTEISAIWPEVDEDAAPLQRHDQAQRAGRFLAGAGQDHDVADPADGQALAVQQRTAPQPGREYLVAGHDHGITSRHLGPTCTSIVSGRQVRRDPGASVTPVGHLYPAVRDRDVPSPMRWALGGPLTRRPLALSRRSPHGGPRVARAHCVWPRCPGGWRRGPGCGRRAVAGRAPQPRRAVPGGQRARRERPER